MEASRTTLRMSLLLLTFGGAILACDTASHNSELSRRENSCAVDTSTFNGANSMCFLKASERSFRENASNARSQIPFGDDNPADSPPYTVLPISGKGLGVIAKIPIPRSTKIIIEAPLLTVPMPSLIPGQGFPLASMLTSITSSFSSLPASSQETFLSLHDHRFPGDEEVQQSHLLTIFRSNAYNTGSSDVGLFPLIARINHSCRPNSVNYWSEKLGKRVIYAGRDIGVGEEITVAYIPLLKSTKERQNRLAQYGFVCGCEACSDTSGESGKRRGKIADLMEVLEQKIGLESQKVEANERLARRAERLVGLLGEEELVDYWAKAYRFVAVFEGRAGNWEGARTWGERVVEELRLAEEESEEVNAALKFLDGLKAQ
ncbi:SET domain-containing protein [Cadophora sp. DSE1049]|nr:SET domain-containing protein [Cadophora sp. DSE1049]